MTPETLSIYEQIRQLPAEEIQRIIDRSQAFLDGLQAQMPLPPAKRGRPRGSKNRRPAVVPEAATA